MISIILLVLSLSALAATLAYREPLKAIAIPFYWSLVGFEVVIILLWSVALLQQALWAQQNQLDWSAHWEAASTSMFDGVEVTSDSSSTSTFSDDVFDQRV